MKSRFAVLFAVVFLAWSVASQAAEPLRVFLRCGPKTHGPGEHDGPAFLRDWTRLLTERGCKVEGAIGFPTAAQLEKTDVMVMYAAEGATITGEDRANLEKFLQRGGGLVAIHDSVCGKDPHWFKTIAGGAWEHKHSKWHEGEVGVYFIDTEHPITRGVSNFDLDDEVYWDLHMMPDAKILATSFQSVFVIAPQMWTYEKDNYRAFVSLQGHKTASFSLPHYRALLLRGIAWAGKQTNVDALCSKEELASLKYPQGGPTAPDKAAQKLNVHPDFRLNLVASEPLFEKAISIDWDPQGRLWVAETPEYPGGRSIHKNDLPIEVDRQRSPEKFAGEVEKRPGRDRIAWLEDSNRDGVMDEKRVFYEGLELVTSLVFYKDGVIVAQAPDILWIRDTNGDGKADKVETLYTGFGTRDSHAVINNFRWGMDGWVYGAIGYSAGDPVSADGKKKFGHISAGIFRFQPDGTGLEQFASGSCNTWGFDFAPDGEAFYSTATCGQHFLHIVLPEKVLARGSVGGVRASAYIADHGKVFPAVHHTRPAYIQIDWVGQFTAAAGCCIYNGGAWPERYNGANFLSDPTVSLVHADFVRPKGVTYHASKAPGREETEFIAGTDLWFRPIHTRVGPDGALYVVDFYNQAAIHNDTRGPAHGANNAAVRPDRDHHFGRIWRVQHKEARKLPEFNLNAKKPAELIKALDHPNGWVRMTAHRLLSEGAGSRSVPVLRKMLGDTKSKSAYARTHALWILHNLGELEESQLAAAANDADPVLSKNALRVMSEREKAGGAEQREAVIARLNDSNPRARLLALIALGPMPATHESAAAIAEIYPGLNDRHLESAAIAAAAGGPLMHLDAAFNSSEPAALTDYARHVVRLLAGKQDAARAAELVLMLAREPASSDALKQVALETLGAELRAEAAPVWTPELQAAFKLLMASPHAGLSGAALPLVARWDKRGSMDAELKPVVNQLIARLSDARLPDDQRAQVAVNLLGVRRLNPDILPGVASLVGSGASAELQRRVIEALGGTGDPAVGGLLTGAFGKLPPDLQEAAFAQLIKRPDWAMTIVEALKAGAIQPSTLGPTSLHRLRTHADKGVADRARVVIDELRGPVAKEKDALIAQFKPAVEKTGNAAKGREVYAQNCANCHKFNGEGNDLAPDLTGMGAHGAEDLLVHILDPNRQVEPNFLAWSIDTRDGETYDGVISRENRAGVTLRTTAGDHEIKAADIQNRRNTGRSLMPEGFEVLGEEAMRDLLTYLCAGETKFRIIDLSGAFTADTTRGIYVSTGSKDETLPFTRYGLIKAGGVPFEIAHPLKTRRGNNVIVLKGGAGYAKTLPQKVEVPNINVPASRLHFLGGVGGWAWPWGGEQNKNLPAAKISVKFADGRSEEIVLRNGVELADYNGYADVPGSKPVPDVLRRGQVRWFTKELKHHGVIQSLTLESFDNIIAPTFVGITAEAGESSAGNGTASVESGAGSRFTWGEGTRTLIVGGGSSHDFDKWFNAADSATLNAAGKVSVQYTDQPSEVRGALSQIDVLYLCNNQPFPDDATRQAILDFAASGKGLLLVHPALWYNWKDWPDYNRVLVAGGSRSHDKYGEFEVSVVEADHPVMKDVPKSFKITDELYHHAPDPAGTPIQVLATGTSPVTGKTFPVVWITKHDKSRVVCITLGHDGRAHEHPAYKQLLQNSLNWVAGK